MAFRNCIATFVALFCMPVMAQTDDLVCAEKTRLQSLLRFRAANNVYHGYNIDYNRCFWRVNPLKNGYLHGNVHAAFTVIKNSDSIGFDLQNRMQVDSVKWQGNKILFTHSGDVVYCYKPGGWTAGSKDSLNIYYQGNPQAGHGFGYYVWDAHQTGPVVHTLSQPYGAAYWWPCKQTLTDKIDSIDIFVSTVPSFKAASNGVLVSSDSLNDTTRVFHWKHRYPVATYLVAIAATNYKEFTNYAHFHGRPDSMPVLNYVFPQSFVDAQKDAPKILPMMRLFDSLFGEYPFAKEKYGHAQFTWAGGMEHQTMSFMVNFSYELMAHELAHQWFGDKVTCGSWTDLWLNEGFATYCTALCYEFLMDGEFANKMAGIRNAATSQEDGSVFARDTNTINRLFSGNLTYNKGAFVIHMLRVRLGDSLFFSSLRKYLNQNNTAYGFARTLDLQEIMELESGQNLDTFFLRWFYGEGFPYLKINWKQLGSDVQITVDQTPSHPTVPVFELRIPLRFRNKNQDTILYFNTTSLKESFHVKLPFAADSAEFDPLVTVLAKAALGGLNLDNTNTGYFTVAPNPAQDDLVLLSFNNIAQKVEVYDLSGRLVAKTPDDFEHLLGDKIQIPMRKTGNGVYVARVFTINSVTSLIFNKL